MSLTYSTYEKISDHYLENPFPAYKNCVHFINNLPPGSLLLDIGCGSGRHLGINKTLSSIGLDYSINNCFNIKKDKYSVVRGDALELPFKDNSIDHVICIQVLHHIETQKDRIKSLKEIARVLSPGGTAYITVWSMYQPNKTIEKQDNLIKWDLSDKYGTELVRFFHYFEFGEFEEIAKNIANIEFLGEKIEDGRLETILVKI